MADHGGTAADGADRSAGRMAADTADTRTELLEARLTGAVIGAFYDVYNALGHGFLESVYARALEIELRRRSLVVERERPVAVWYQGAQVGAFRADVVVESRLILELKAAPVLAPADRRQLYNYLRASEIEVGLLLHFGPRPRYVRLVATKPRRAPPHQP